MVNPYLIALLTGEVAGMTGATFENMARNKKMMEDERRGRDDFYHMKASCEAGQAGLVEALASQVLGGLKEVRDLYCKTNGKCANKKLSWDVAWTDSKKDLKNNWNGVKLGVVNPKEQCRVLVDEYLKRHRGSHDKF